MVLLCNVVIESHHFLLLLYLESTFWLNIFVGLCRYGGIYLDSDIIVLNSLSSLDNTVGLENPRAGSSLNGAVMAFRKHRYTSGTCVLLA